MTKLTPQTDAPRCASTASALEQLRPIFGSRLSLSRALRDQHASQLTWLVPQPPDAVIFAESTEEVALVAKVCSAFSVPIIPFGAGTSFEGQVNAPRGGICLDLSRMNAILDVHAEDMDARVQAGVTRTTLNQYLRDTGLFFPIDPGADASLGGMASTRASGTNAVRYGTMRESVLSLTVVTPDGQIVKTANRARKSSAGLDLTRLFIGAEGTLGIITELVVRLHPQPESIIVASCPFPSLRTACDAVIATMQSGIPVARIEFLDRLTVRAVNAYSKLDLPDQPLLLLEFHGSTQGTTEQVERFCEIAEAEGGGPFTYASDPETRNRLWAARHNAYWACCALRPGARPLPTDVCVPISRLADCLAETAVDVENFGLIAPIVGHVGDGNFHVQPLVDLNAPHEVEALRRFSARLVSRAISMDGTCTGEHGVGQEKARYLPEELGEPAIDLMRRIKAALDPAGIMNPGKMLVPLE
jgi:D-lactate dehydrogenase (cytochrome)